MPGDAPDERQARHHLAGYLTLLSFLSFLSYRNT